MLVYFSVHCGKEHVERKRMFGEDRGGKGERSNDDS